jgi:hypothetical protein
MHYAKREGEDSRTHLFAAPEDRRGEDDRRLPVANPLPRQDNTDPERRLVRPASGRGAYGRASRAATGRRVGGSGDAASDEA